MKTPIAVLGTLAEFHRQAIPYDLATLVRLVASLHPDLLCLDLAPEQWRARDFAGLPPEYHEALVPLAYQTDIVVVPIGQQRQPADLWAPGWRGWLIRGLRSGLATIYRLAPGPAAVNQGLYHFLADLLYELSAWLAGRTARQTWKAHTDHLVRQVLAVAERDPGCRILVAVNVRHCHHIRHALRRLPDQIQVVSYSEL